MPFYTTNEGFMEPTRHVTYYEDAYTKFKYKDDFVEANDFDLCEDSSEEDVDNSKAKHKRRHVDSYGSIKKPTYKPRVEKSPPFKISPNRNSRHSIRLFSLSSDEDEQPEHLSGHTSQLNTGPAQASTSQALREEKAWQHSLSGQARFDNVRRQRAADRLRLHRACQQARKTKERALRDAEIAAAYLVDAVPTSDSYMQVDIDRSEVPSDFVDLTRQDGRRKERKLATKTWPPKKNWKGEDMDLATGDAYVLIMDRE